MTLRAYQQAALDRARDHYAAGAQAVLLCMPTGTGKTRTAAEACAGHTALGGQPLFVAPRRELVTQAKQALRDRGLELAWVRTIQELSREGASIPPATMVVLDEARHYVSDEWSKLRAALPDAIYLGLDATPERGDGRGLGGMFDALVEAITVGDAIAEGYLVQPQVLRPERALGHRELALDPVDAYMQHAPGSSGVIFAPSVEVAIQYACELRARGVEAAAVFGEMSDAARDAALASYARGETKVLTNAQLLTEGWDAPLTETIILARHFGTAGGLLQACGRGLRPAPGKARCLLLDLVGATHVHGDVDEPRTWHLEGKAARRASDDIDVRFCPVCGHPVTGPECAECNYSGEMRKRKPRVLGLPIDRFAREHAMPDDRAARELAGLLRAARRKGYRDGWAIRIFEHKYGRRVTPTLRRMANASG